MATMRPIMRWATLLLCAGLLSACSKGMNDLVARVDEIKSRKGLPIEPLPVMKDPEPFEYEALDLRDPFSPSIDEQRDEEAAGPRPDANRPKEPLESYPLDSLDMVGTLGLGSDMRALMKDPDGVIHQVRADNYVGQNYGRITAIFEDHIEMVELIPNGVGGWIEKPASISLESD
jgi:type IV pilus assembly protein PilP